MQSPVEEIKTRLDIVDFIGTYVALKRAGANFKANCPFHQEKTPSFMVSKPKQFWHCFGCNEGGDIFKFLMKIDGLDFPEALKILADKAGIELPRYDARAQSQKNTLLAIVKRATEFYAAQLYESSGQFARDYLTRRGLTEAVIKQFGLGYAPDSWDALTSALSDQYKAEEVFAAGLTIRSERNQGFYDRFRHRIMFPIRDVHGNPVGFTSRLLDETRAEGKYVNTPETLIYNKGRVLYGLDLAREAIRRSDYAILVEGNMDVIACHQFGQTNVVAASGTALTFDQVRLLKRYTNNLMISFDADAAGEHAAKRGIDIALTEGVRVKVITIPSGFGKDPDECIRKNIKAWEQAVKGAREIMEYYISKASVQYNVATASGRAQFVNTLLAEIRKLSDAIEQDFWLKRIGEVAKVDEKLLRDQMRRLNKEQGTRNKEQKNEPPALSNIPLVKPRLDLLSERVLALFTATPDVRELIIANLLPEMVSPTLHQELYTQIVACYTSYNSTGSALAGADFSQFWHTWLQKVKPELLSTADILELLGDKEFGQWEKKDLDREADTLCREIRRHYTKRRRVELSSAMRTAEGQGDHQQVDELTQEFKTLGN